MGKINGLKRSITGTGLVSGLIVAGLMYTTPQQRAFANSPLGTNSYSEVSSSYEDVNLLKESRLLAQLVYAESANQPFEAKKEVAQVVVNRILDKDYPNSLEGVLYQKNAFPSVGNKQWRKVEDMDLNPYEMMVLGECYVLAKNTLKKKKKTKTMAFHSDDVAPENRYLKNLSKGPILGRMHFYSKRNS